MLIIKSLLFVIIFFIIIINKATLTRIIVLISFDRFVTKICPHGTHANSNPSTYPMHSSDRLDSEVGGSASWRGHRTDRSLSDPGHPRLHRQIHRGYCLCSSRLLVGVHHWYERRCRCLGQGSQYVGLVQLLCGERFYRIVYFFFGWQSDSTLPDEKHE